MVDIIGITEQDERVFRALVCAAGAPAADVAARADLPPAVVTDSIERLVALGLLAQDTPGTYRPVRPDLALDEQLVAAEQELLQQHRTLMQARRDIADLVEAYSSNAQWAQEAVEVERVDGKAEIEARLDELLRPDRRADVLEVLQVTPRLDFEIRTAADVHESDPELLRTGTTMRSIVPQSVYGSPDDLLRVREATMAGDEHRVHDNPSIQMLIIDRQVAVLPVEQAEAGRAAMLVRAPSLLVCYLALFEVMWRQSKPLVASAGLSAMTDGLTPRERQLLELMNAGVTDETAARQMNCSVRTVRRDSDALYKRLGVTTRFQAGVEAARRGWI